MRTSYYKIYANRLPNSFDGMRIAQISDLHNKDFRGTLLSRLATENPDAIVITGDMIDREGQTDAALAVVEGSVKLAPVYYVNGNHESVLTDYGAFRDALIGMGVRVLENDSATIERNGEKLFVLGLSDPRFFVDGKTGFRAELVRRTDELREWGYVVLLSHRPELFCDYVRCGVDLAFVGHAHGGQVRVPFIGALFAPNQGFFPKLTTGEHRRGESVMVISKGLGKSGPIPRLFNPPELVVVTLMCGARSKSAVE